MKNTWVWIGVGAVAGAIYSMVHGTPTTGPDPADALGRVFVIGTALFVLGMVESQLPFPLFKLGALGVGIYLFIKGDQKRGAGLAVTSMVMIALLSMLQGGQRSRGVSAPLDSPGAQG